MARQAVVAGVTPVEINETDTRQSMLAGVVGVHETEVIPPSVKPPYQPNYQRAPFLAN